MMVMTKPATTMTTTQVGQYGQNATPQNLLRKLKTCSEVVTRWLVRRGQLSCAEPAARVMVLRFFSFVTVIVLACVSVFVWLPTLSHVTSHDPVPSRTCTPILLSCPPRLRAVASVRTTKRQCDECHGRPRGPLPLPLRRHGGPHGRKLGAWESSVTQYRSSTLCLCWSFVVVRRSRSFGSFVTVLLDCYYYYCTIAQTRTPMIFRPLLGPLVRPALLASLALVPRVCTGCTQAGAGTPVAGHRAHIRQGKLVLPRPTVSHTRAVHPPTI
jgi:hypothetical protein